MTTKDDLIKKYSLILQAVYDTRTAGDHTFTGVLSTFLHEVEALVVEEKEPQNAKWTSLVTASDRLSSYKVLIMTKPNGDLIPEESTCECGDFKYRHNHECKHIRQLWLDTVRLSKQNLF